VQAALRLSRISGLAHEPLLRAITASGEEAIAAYRAWRRGVDFEGPIDGETTALLPQLYGALARLRLEDPLAGVFKGIGRRAWYENQTLLSAAQPALRALADKGIRFVAVGEVPLVLGCYGSLSQRRIGQIDLVVSPGEARDAVRLIRDTGWQAALLAEEEVTYRHVRQFAGPDNRSLALHWRFIGSAPRTTVDDFFRQRCQLWRLQDVPALMLNGDAMLLHLLLSDIPPPAAMPALWIADIISVLRQGAESADWPAVASFAIKQKLAARLEQRLRLLAGFGVEVPAAELRRLGDARGLPETIDRLLLQPPLRCAAGMPSKALSVLPDYLRSDCRADLVRSVAVFSHFLRHRWGLHGRRQILPAIVRGLRRRR
jgi:hypothetical protein